MAKKSAVMILADRIARDIVADQTRIRLAMGFDAAIIAAHEALGMGPGRAAAFAEEYSKALNELGELFISDAEGDRNLEYAKAKRDQVIREIVGEDNFAPFDVSYGGAYMDELKRVRSMEGRR